MGKPIIKEFFASSKFIWSNVARLHYIDKAIHSKKFGDSIKRRSKYIFQHYFPLLSDDSKHFKRNRHILIMTTFEVCDTEEWTTANFVYPTFRLVTSAVNMVKYSNAQMNVDELIDLLGLEVAEYVGGGTTDNATDSIKYTRDTFNSIMDACSKSDDTNINKLQYIN